MNKELSTKIEKMIFIIRDQKVMMDSDLAELYAVDTRTLTLFEPNFNELEDLRCQFGTANRITTWNHMRRSIPLVFTENGVAMLSSVLNSEQAIQINILIMRTFTQLKKTSPVENRITNLEKNTNKLFEVVFERMDSYEEMLVPKLPDKRKKIGIKNE